MNEGKMYEFKILLKLMKFLMFNRGLLFVVLYVGVLSLDVLGARKNLLFLCNWVIDFGLSLGF